MDFRWGMIADYAPLFVEGVQMTIIITLVAVVFALLLVPNAILARIFLGQRMGAQLLIEAKLKPADIGFVRLGLSALVKLSAYDYYTYGGLRGSVEYISPDALGDDGKTGAPDRTYYRVLIRSEQPSIQSKGKSLDVIPGMTARVEIRTGERSVLQFLLKPVLRSKEAFRER